MNVDFATYLTDFDEFPRTGIESKIISKKRPNDYCLDTLPIRRDKTK